MAHYKRRNCKCDPSRKCTCGGKKWTFWLDIGRDPKTGERRQITKGGFTSKKDAEAAVNMLIADKAQGTFIKESDILFKDFADEWLPIYIERNSPKPGTVRLRSYSIRKLLPYLAHIKLKNVTTDIYQEALNDIKLGQSTMEGIHATGKMIFEMAVRKKLIKENPTRDAYIKKEPKTIDESNEENFEEALPNYFEKEELKTFLDTARKHGIFMDALIFTLLAYTGMRIGELVALKWKDIDFNKKTIRINKGYYNEHNNILKYSLIPPKTKASRRKIMVANLVIELLNKHKEEQDKIISRLGNSYNNKGYIFTNVKIHPGYPILPKLVLNRMERLLKLTDLNQELTTHSLRHTHTSLLAEAGVKLEDIKDRLGHFDDEMTRRIYLHVTDPVKREAADKFDKLMDSVY